MADSKEKGEASSTAGKAGGQEPSLEELLRSLNLKGEDIDGLFVAKDEVESLKEEAKWMAVMKLMTTKPFSAVSLKKTMRFAWAPAQEVVIRDVEENRFLVQASCLGDWKRITEQGPWLFRDHGLLIEKYDGSCSVKSVELNRIHAWARIHDIPELYRRKKLIWGLAGSIGEVLRVEMNGSGPEGGDFVRARVWLDVQKCLTWFVSFKPEDAAPVIMRVKYEKIPRFCGVCGLLGHKQEECGTGEHADGACGFGKWLLADTPWNKSQLFGQASRTPGRDGQGPRAATGGRGGGGRAGRTGRGRGGRAGGLELVVENRKRTSTDASLSEVSPVKDVEMGAPG
jgi:hypothetical protein